MGLPQGEVKETVKLSIVIVNWNGGDLLLDCLRSIRESVTDFGVQVFVVDNDSHDGSRERAESAFPEFTILNSGANLGFGRANNLVRSRVVTPLVLFLNPDTVLQRDTLQVCVEQLESLPEAGALGCKMLYPSGDVQQLGLQWFPSPWTILLESLVDSHRTRRWFGRWLPVVNPRQSTFLRKLYGGFLLARKEVLDRVGWFDERYFMYAEDVDLSRKITDLGWSLYYCADAEITHVAGGASAKAPSGFSVLMKQESIGKLMRQYHGRSGEWTFRVAVLLGAVLRSLVLILSAPFSPSLRRNQGVPWRDRLSKQRLMARWALGLQKPVIPGPHAEVMKQASSSAERDFAGDTPRR